MRPLVSGNNVYLEQIFDYPVSYEVEFRINHEKAESFAISFRIPSWCRHTIIAVNRSEIKDIRPGAYKHMTRFWKKYYKVLIKMDLIPR